MKIALASDHRGFNLKEKLKKFLEKIHRIEDFGTNSVKSVDYPDFAMPAVKSIIFKKNQRAILICGSGIGMSMAANKIKGARAALIYNKKVAEISRLHNNANVMCLGADFINFQKAKNWIKIWLKTPFEGGRHLRRIKKFK